VSLITLNYPDTIAGIQITPLWWNLVSYVHDKNFYYKDLYTFPILGNATVLTGTVSSDVVGIDVYRGSINKSDSFQAGARGSIPAEKISSIIPINGAYTFLLPPCAPGEVEINAVAYDGTNREVARTRIGFVTTYWACLLWGLYVELMGEAPSLLKLLNPWLSQDYVGVPEIVSNFLPMARLPQVNWPSLDAARAVVRDALQSIYLHPISNGSLVNYTTDWLGSRSVLQDPTHWVLGGTDWRSSGSIAASVGASFSAGFPLLSTLLRSGAFTTPLPVADYTVDASGNVSLTSVSHTFHGSLPLFEIDILSFNFLSGDWLGVATYDTPFTQAWTDYSPTLSTPTKISTPGDWSVSPMDRNGTAQSIVSAWNATIQPLYGLQATYLGSLGRITISGSGGTLSDYSNIQILKGGPNPSLTPIKITRTRPIDFLDPDTVSINALGNGALQTYGALFLGRAGSPQRHILEGTVTAAGNSTPYRNGKSLLSLSETWVPPQDLTTIDIPLSSIAQDADGSRTGTVGHWYTRLPQALYSLESYDLNGITPVVVPPDVLDLGNTTPTASGSVTYYPLPVEALNKEVARISPSFFVPEVEIDQPWVGPSTSSAVYYTEDLNAFSSGANWVDSYSGLVADSGVWTVGKTTALTQDSSCYDTSQYVPTGIFSVGDVVVVGRDRVTISSIQTIQYVGDRLYYTAGLQENHYAGEIIYVPDDVLPKWIQSGTLDLLQPGLPVPPGKNLLFDLVDELFGNTTRTVQIQWADSPSGFAGNWTTLDPPMQLLSSPLDAMGGPTSMGSEYQPWALSQSASGTYTVSPLYGTSNSVPGFYPSGCTRITGYSSSTTIGVQKSFPRGIPLSSDTLTFWARTGSASGGSCTIDFSQRVPLGSLEGATSLEYSIPWTAPASGNGWQQINVDISSIPLTIRTQISTIRFRVLQNLTWVDISMLYPQRYYRYFQVKILVYNTQSRVDYVLTRVGARTQVSKQYPAWPIVSL
jgi:hypothetical protein